jgi:hypothetical protein
MGFACCQLIQIGTTLHCRHHCPLGHVNAFADSVNAMLGAEHVRQLFCKFAFGFLQNLTNNSK